MNEITITGTLSLLPETKAQQATFVEKLINEVLEGNVNPLKAEAMMVNLESICKKYRADKQIKSAVLNEVEKYHKDELQNLHNAKFTIKEVGVKYDYSLCGHPAYNAICNDIDSLLETKKQLEAEMKLKTKNWIFVDSETGETAEIYPPAKTSTTAVAVEIL